MEHVVTKNYFADGGDTLVIGGKLVVEEGAEVEGLSGGESYTLPKATTSKLGGVKAAANQAATEAEDVAGLVTAFNDLLAKLKAAGLMVAD